MSAASSLNCQLCRYPETRTSAALGLCAGCLRTRVDFVRPRMRGVHAASRAALGLPRQPPQDPVGIRCPLCSNQCVIGEGRRGFCGLRAARGGKLVHLAGTPRRGLLQWYRDPLPTICVADWVCEGSSHPGFHNLAVFYQSCTANCLYCQNWHFRLTSPDKSRAIAADELAAAADSRTFCVCYFGGDPASQMPHALATSRHLASRGVRLCWETNGTMHTKLLDAAVEYALRSGGCVKFDLKAFDDHLHQALTDLSSHRTLENFGRAARRHRDRPEPPLIVASTLLVPGYVDADQVGKIAAFVASINPQIPCALLAFALNFYMGDLPCTSAEEARDAEAAARAAGLSRVRIGNRHLLSRAHD